MSVMRIVPDSEEVSNSPGREPLLVSIRYLDTGLTHDLDKVQLVAGAHIAPTAKLRPGEHALTLVSSRGRSLGYIVWRPDSPGDAVWNAMAPTAGLALGGLLAVLSILLFSVAKLMRRDARSLEQLGAAHIELKAKEAQAYHRAYHDALTGLPNRAYFNLVGDRMVAASHGQEPWAILLVDLDRFKRVNDTYGHLGGDILIRQVADRLQDLTSRADVVARLGGDEFAILLSERTTEEEIAWIAEAMVAVLREPFEILGAQVFIGASIGVACYPICSGTTSDLMRMADIAMYHAKAGGRDTFRFFTDAMDDSVKLRRAIEHDLRDALKHKRDLLVHYQPRMNSTVTRVVGLEALMRWEHPERGTLSPEMFVPIAEETGLIRDLGRWVLEEACGVARTWPDLSIAVSLSPAQFRCRAFAAEVEAIVRKSGVRPQQIELEITESILCDHDEAVIEALSKLRSAGFRIVLDDFGTGYSSLSYLRKFEVDKIKIDRSFTTKLGEVNDATAIVQAVIQLGHAMGLTVSAAGIETAEQRKILEFAGCNELQGFLFSGAVSKEKLGKLIMVGPGTVAA